jgi:hypothetical protein
MVFHAVAWIAAVDVRTPSRSNSTASKLSRVTCGTSRAGPGAGADEWRWADMRRIVLIATGLGNRISSADAATPAGGH